MMYTLEELESRHRVSFLVMLSDYAAEDPSTLKALYPGDWHELQFLKFIKECERERMDWRPKAGEISVTRYVLTSSDGAICGNGLLRFPLTEELESSGGNLVFDVPPSKRREGFGALVLNRMLFEAVRAGLARVLVVCAADNPGARKVIEKNRGLLESDSGGLLRYWLNLR